MKRVFKFKSHLYLIKIKYTKKKKITIKNKQN